MTTIESILKRCHAEGDCLIWARKPTAKGYAVTSHEGKQWRVHRLVYTLAVGPIPEGHHVHHTCGRKMCVARGHLVTIDPSAHARLHRTTGPAPRCRRGHERRQQPSGAWACPECGRLRARRRSRPPGPPTDNPSRAPLDGVNRRGDRRWRARMGFTR